MLDAIDALRPETWAGIAGLVAALGSAWAAVIVARRGAKRSPPELGLPKPPADMDPYLLREIRDTNRKLTALQALQSAANRGTERRLEEIAADMRILLDRGRR